MQKSKGEHPETIYEFQQKAMPFLLGWGMASMLGGIPFVRNKSPFLKHVGIQFLAWGAIDALIALLGLRSATRKQRAWELGEIPPEQVTKDRAGFQRIVGINAGLDVAYLLAGRALMRADRTDLRKQGAGLGVLIQGAFLLIWDALLLVFAR
jgi:hypothetical protein